MTTNLRHLIDFGKVEVLLEGFNKTTGFVTAIVDLDGNILSKSGWSQICTEFHRVNPDTSKKCNISDTELANRMVEGEKYHFYKCLNGLVDVVVPIVINGEHIANLFSGQFFFEEPDKSFFLEQATKYGFDEKEYLDALSKIPIIPEEKVKTAMDFLLNMTRMISEITFQKTEQIQLNKTISESEEKFRTIYENINDAVFIHKILHNGEPGNFLYFNHAAQKMLGYTSEELKSMSPRELDDPDNSRQYIPKVMKQLTEQRMSKFEAVQIAKGGRKIDIEVNAVITNIGGEDLIVSVCRDITQMKAVQRYLTEKEQFLSAIYKGISHSIFVVDVLENGDFQYAGLNPQHEKITGISTDFIKGKKPADVLPEEAALNVCKHYAECIAKKQPIAYEEWLPFRGQQTCWETILNPQINESGNVYQIIGTSHEITERWQSEEKLRESEEKLKSIFVNMTDAVWSISWPDLTHNFISPALEKLYERSKQELLDNPNLFQDITHPDDQHLTEMAMKQLLEEGKAERECRIIKPDGSIVWVNDRSKMIYDGHQQPIRVDGVTRDITEQKTIQQKLQDTVNYQNLLLNNDPTLIYFKDCNNNIIRVTESVAKATGLTREKIEGRPSKEIYPDMADQYWEDDLEVIKSGKPKLNIIEPLTGADGSSHWLLTNKIPVKNNLGEIVGVTVFSTDITELKNAELGLIAAKEKAERNEIELIKAQKIAHLGSWYLNIETNEVTWTEELYKMYGFDPAMPPPPYTEHMKLFTPESWKILSTSLAKTRETGIPYELELKTIRNDNRNGWMWVRGEAVLDKGNKITGLWGAAQDITERKQAEQELIKAKEKTEESEQRFRSLIENAPDGVVIIDEHGKFKYISPNAERLFGYHKDEAIGHSGDEYTHPDDLPLVLKTMETILADPGQKPNLEYRFKRKNGDYRWIETTFANLLSDKAINGIILNFTDITERKQIFEELVIAKDKAEESEERFTLAMKASNDGLFDWNLETNEIYYSPGWKKMLGYEEHELPNDFSVWENITDPEGIKKLRELHQKLISRQIDRLVMEFKMQHKAGHWLDILSRAEAIFDGRGKAVRMVGTHTDITRHKNAEEHLQKFKQIVSSTSDGIALLDKNYRYVIVNNAYENFSAIKQDDLIGLSVSEYLGEEVFDKSIRANFDRCLKGETIKFRDWFDYPTLGKRFVEVSYFPYINAVGMISGVVANSRDITEHWQAEEELRISKELLSETESIGKVGGWSFNIDTMVQKWTDEVFRIHEAEISPNPGVDAGINYYTEQSRPIIEKAVQRAIEQGENFDLELEIITAKGNIRAVHTIGKADIENRRIHGFFQDITGRKQAESALKNRENLLNRVFDILPIGLWFADANGRLIRGNPAGVKIWGAEPTVSIEEYGVFKARRFPSGQVIAPDDWALAHTIREGVTIENEELEIDAFDGQKKIILNYTAPVLDEEGNIQGAIVVNQDITARKQAEMLLQEKSEEIAVQNEELNQANQKLLSAKDKAEESDRLKSAFLANMSHEIRTPMNGILGFADLLKEPGLTGEEQQSYINIIEKSGKRMLNIINDIIDISKIEAGLMEPDISESNINEQIEYIYTFFKPEAETKGINLSFKKTLPAKNATIRTDREKVYAILTNLVKNAIKYTHEGSVEMGCVMAETGHVLTLPHQTFLQIYVKDTGIGVPIDRQEAIFERFVQADIEDRKAYQGAGLGLAITKAYVEMLGGKIWVESDPDGKPGVKGSTFYFTLPYNPEPERTKAVY